MPTLPAVAPVDGEPIKGAIPINSDDLLATKSSVDMDLKLVTLLTHSEIEVLLKKEKVSSSLEYVGLMSPYLDEITTKPYRSEYKVLKFQKFDGQKGDSKEHVACFVD